MAGMPRLFQGLRAWIISAVFYVLRVGASLAIRDDLHENVGAVLSLPITVDGSSVDLTFMPLDDLEGLARAFVNKHGLKRGGECPDDNCMVDMIHREMMRVPGFRESHDAALGLSCETDSTDYHILAEARERIATQGVPGLTCEIGLRSGGSSELLMRLGSSLGDVRRHVGIDPFGDLPYATTDVFNHSVVMAHMGYDNSMRRKTLRDLYAVAHELGTDLHVYDMEDTEFFARFSDGIPVYEHGERQLINTYALVHFDGPHTLEAVAAELAFFVTRTPPGGLWVLDDIVEFDHDGKLHELLVAHGMVQLARGKWKAVYQRVT